MFGTATVDGEVVVAEATMLCKLADRTVGDVPIHPTAIVDSTAHIAESAEIGPYSIVGADVEIGARTQVKGHVFMEGPLTIGEDNVFFPYSTVGVAPQDLKYKGERSETRIGHRNRIREFCTIHRGTEGGGMVTSIGDDNLLMAYIHVAHDVQLAATPCSSHAATLGGHVTVEDWALDRRGHRSPSVLPHRPARDRGRLQRDHAGRAAVLKHGDRARSEGVRRQCDRARTPRVSPPSDRRAA